VLTVKLSAWSSLIVFALMLQDTGGHGISSTAVGPDRVTQIVTLLTLLIVTAKSWLDARRGAKVDEERKKIAEQQVEKIHDLGTVQGQKLDDIKAQTDGQLTAAMTKISNLEKMNSQLVTGMSDISAMLAESRKLTAVSTRRR
jgi:hypothetical protein